MSYLNETLTNTEITPPSQLQLDPLETSQPAVEISPECAARYAIPRSDWTGDDQSTLSSAFRHTGWATIRSRVYASLWRTVQPQNRLDAFSTCGDRIRVLRSDQDPDRYRLAGNYCHDRWCTPCANERARTISRNVLELAGSEPLRFVTLTLSARATPLKVRVRDIRLYFARLKRTTLWKRSVRAGIACLHVKRYENEDAWHVHYHLLIQGRFIPKVELSNAWHTITVDSKIVDIRLANDRRQVANHITKYASKPLDMGFARDPDLLDEALLALKGVRLVDTFGEWRGKPITEVDHDGTWTEVCSLDHLLLGAHNRDPWCLNIIRTIRGKRVEDGLIAASLYQPPVDPRPPPIDPATLPYAPLFTGCGLFLRPTEAYCTAVPAT